MANSTFQFLLGSEAIEMGVQDGDLVVRSGGNEVARVKANGTGTGAFAGGGGTVNSVTAGDGSILIGGTATAPTVAVAASGVGAGTYGDASHVPQFTVDATGRVSGVAAVPISSPAATALEITSVLQASHGFTVNALTPVRFNGTSWVKSQADSLADSEVNGIAVGIDANTFNLFLPGSQIATSGATAGVQYLSPTTAGTFTATQPTTVGQVVKKVGLYTSATVFLFKPDTSLLIEASPLLVKVLDDSTHVTAANLIKLAIPSALNGLKLLSAEMAVTTAPATNAIDVKINNNAGASMFTTDPQIAVGKTNNTQTGGVVAVVNAANAGVATGDVITVVGVTADAGAADTGLTFMLQFG